MRESMSHACRDLMTVDCHQLIAGQLIGRCCSPIDRRGSYSQRTTRISVGNLQGRSNDFISTEAGAAPAPVLLLVGANAEWWEEAHGERGSASL